MGLNRYDTGTINKCACESPPVVMRLSVEPMHIIYWRQKMTVFRNKIVILFCVFGLLLFGLFVMPASASTTPPNHIIIPWNYPGGWAMWAVEVDFIGERPNGRMLIQIGYTDQSSGNEILVHHQWYEIPCYEVGKIEYKNGTIAVFNGKGSYIHCEMFDMLDTVAAITEGGLQLQPFGVQSEIIVKVSAAPKYVANKSNPIFYSDAGFSYSLPNTHISDIAYMHLDFEHSGSNVSSDSFKLRGMDGHSARVIGSNIISGRTKFENSLLSQVVTKPLTLTLSSKTSDLYIGANPRTGEYFSGEMEHFFVDPLIFPACC